MQQRQLSQHLNSSRASSLNINFIHSNGERTSATMKRNKWSSCHRKTCLQPKCLSMTASPVSGSTGTGTHHIDRIQALDRSPTRKWAHISHLRTKLPTDLAYLCRRER